MAAYDCATSIGSNAGATIYLYHHLLKPTQPRPDGSITCYLFTVVFLQSIFHTYLLVEFFDIYPYVHTGLQSSKQINRSYNLVENFRSPMVLPRTYMPRLLRPTTKRTETKSCTTAK